jgi:hypothetical protein
MRCFAIVIIGLILAGCAAQFLPTSFPPPATARPQGVVDCQVHNVDLAPSPRGTLVTLNSVAGWWHGGFNTLAVNVDGSLEFSQTTRAFLDGDISRAVTETVESFGGVAPAADVQRLQSLIASPAFGAIKDCRQRIAAADGDSSYLSIINAQGEQTFELSAIEPPAVLQEIWEIARSLIGSATTLQLTCVYTRVDLHAAPVLQSCEQR